MAGARHYSELIVWKLADEIRIETFKLTARAGFARDFKLRSQIEDAINSVCRNIAEGFGADTHAEFARFLGFSRRSLNEVQDALRGATLKNYVTTADCTPIRMLLRRLYPAMGRFTAYLMRMPKQRQRPSRASTSTRSRDRTAPHSVIAPTRVRTIAPTSVRRIAPTIEETIAPTSAERSHQPAPVRSHPFRTDTSRLAASRAAHRRS